MAAEGLSATTPSRLSLSIPYERVGLMFAHVYVLGFCGVLLGGFVVQFAEAEMPCPLCVLQRMAMMLCALGPLTIIQRSREGRVTAQDFAMGWGLAIISALGGAAIAIRQILLHIVPPDPGYGSEVFGFHLYTWAFITFSIAILAAAVNLLFAHHLVPHSERLGVASTATIWLFGAVIVAVTVVTFVEEGFNWVLPDDPTRYELLYQLGLR